MAKTKEQIEELKQKISELDEELQALSDDELDEVTGGIKRQDIGKGRLRVWNYFHTLFGTSIRKDPAIGMRETGQAAIDCHPDGCI